MPRKQTRRTFIKHVGYAGAAMPLAMPYLNRAEAALSKLTVAFVGTGGRAGAHVNDMKGKKQNCAAFCDVDKGRWGGPAKTWSEAKGYTDYRKMYDKHHKEFDTVFVACPDHSHYGAAMAALKLSKNVYCEKPLAWSVWECQQLAKEYNYNKKVVTQMGNQGHAGNGWRAAHGWITAGVLGEIKEFHTWTNRPVWPQGQFDRPKGEDPVPDNLDWESWIGPAPMRPFKNKVYHSFKWRGFWDFGTGAMGDMACHTTDGIHAIMKPGYPTSIEPLKVTGAVGDQYQAGGIIKYSYPATQTNPPFDVFWYEGSYRGEAEKKLRAEHEDLKGAKIPKTGNFIIGTKGKMLVEGDYWNRPSLVGDLAKSAGNPNITIPRSPGHHNEFVAACKGEKPREFSMSNFGYSGPMTAKIQLGNIAFKVGKKIEWDGEKVTNVPEANQFIRRKPRKGWEELVASE